MKKLILINLTIIFISGIFAQHPMTPEDLWKFKRINNIQVSPDNMNILISATKFDIEQNSNLNQLYIYSVKKRKLKIVGEDIIENHFKEEALNINSLPDEKFAAKWRPDGKKITFLSLIGGEYQLFQSNIDGTDLLQITNIERGITSYKYSSDLSKILFTVEVKDDESEKFYPDLLQSDVNVFDDLMYRHWDSWSDNRHSHILFADYSSQEVNDTKDIMAGQAYDSPLKPFGKIEQIDISGDGKYIAYTCIKEEGRDLAISTNSDIYIYNSTNSRTINLSANNYGYDLNPVFSPDGKKLAWLSMNRAGFKDDKKCIKIYDFETGTSINYSEEFEESASNLVWSSDNKFLFFISGTQATYQIFQLDIEKEKISQITSGDHDYTKIKYAGNNLIGLRQSMNSPSEVFSIKISNGNEKQLSFLNEKELAELKFGEVEKRIVETTDKKNMLVWLIYPPDFDKNKSYPAILYAPDGPQIAVSQTFSYDFNFQLMAANGYIVIAPNRRGVPTFGKKWKDDINREHGGQCMIDLINAVEEIAKEPFVDNSRIAAVGKNFGGFSVYWLAGNKAKLFKAFVAHSGIFHLESWYGTTDELFFPNWELGGSYVDSDKEKSYKISPHKFVHNWKTPMLITHGENDFRIPISQSVEAFSAARMRGVPSRFLYFQDEANQIKKPQNVIFWHRAIFDWLKEYVKTGSEMQFDIIPMESESDGVFTGKSNGVKNKSERRMKKNQGTPAVDKGKKK